MKRIDPFQFYELGIAMRELSGLEGERTVSDAFSPIVGARGWLRRLLADDPLVELRHCRHSAENLSKAIEGIYVPYMTGEDGNLNLEKWNAVIPSHRFFGLSEALERFEHNLAAEMRDAAIYAASQVGMYHTGDLVDRTELHIPDDLRDSVNDNAIFEIKSAGRCLAFGLPTACGFHILRAAESVLEDYYGLVSGKPGATQRGWHDYAEALEKLSEGDDKEAPSKRVIRSIRQIKDLDRNPIMHPRDVLGESDAMILFMVATSAIAQMAKHLRDASGQAELQLVAVEGGQDDQETG